MNYSKKILIGGKALVNLGSSRSTNDTDYLINDATDSRLFIFDEVNNVDYINAAAHPFFGKIWEMELTNETGVASLKALIELKAFAFVQHCLNRKFQKADDCEYDIKFITRLLGRYHACPIAKSHMSSGEYSEVCKVILSVKDFQKISQK